MEFITIFLPILLLIILSLKNIDLSRNDESELQAPHSTDKPVDEIASLENRLEAPHRAEDEYNIDLSVFPDRADAIVFHKLAIIKACNEGNTEQANLSFAKLIESCRQQNAIENGKYEEALRILISCYDVFRETFKLEYPGVYLPPVMRKSPEFIMTKRNKRASIRKGEKIVHYLMQYSESSNKKFTLCWNYSGELYLFKNDKIEFEKNINTSIRRCIIGNNGNFIFIESSPNSEPLRNSLLFFHLDRKLFEKKYKAIIFSISISSCGDYVVCQTANSDNEDGNTLSFFNLAQKKLVWQKRSEIFWTYSYRFDIENQKIWFIDKEYGEFAYNFDGCFIDKAKYEIECRKRAAPWEICDEAKELIRQINKAESEEKERLTNQASVLINEAFQKLEQHQDLISESIAYRLKGEIAELKNNKEEAIGLYEKALTLNPKVGVKMRLNQLRKKLNTY